jgi:hypothetical protein
LSLQRQATNPSRATRGTGETAFLEALEAAVALNKEQLDALVSLVFGTIVRHIRQQRNQTKGPFAALIDLSADELDWIEDGTETSVTTLYKLSEVLGISAARLAASLQITTNRLHSRNDVAAAVRQKDWDKVTGMITGALGECHDLLKLPPPEQLPLAIPAPPPKMSNEVYTLQPGGEAPMRLTRIADAEDEAEPDFDDELDDDEFDDEPEEAPSVPAQPVRNHRSGPRKESPMPEVVVKPATNQGVQRRGPGRPRKYPVPSAVE